MFLQKSIKNSMYLDVLDINYVTLNRHFLDLASATLMKRESTSSTLTLRNKEIQAKYTI